MRIEYLKRIQFSQTTNELTSSAMVVPFLTALLLFIGTLLYVFRNGVKWFLFYLTTDFPGPTLWQLGTVHARRFIRSGGRGGLDALKEVSESFGFKPWGLWMYGEYLVIITDWRSMTEVFKNKHTTDKPPFYYKNVAEFGANGLLSLNGATYKRHRKIISKAFRKDLLEAHLPRVNDECEEVLKQFGEANGETVDVCLPVYLQSISTALTIFSSGKYTYPGSLTDFLQALRISLKLTHEKSLNPIGYWLNRSKNKNAEDYLTCLKSKIREAFLDAKSDANMLLEGDGRPSNLLQMLYENVDEDEDRFTEEEFFQETVSTIGAAFEASGTTQVACMYFLAWHPEVQERVHDEIKSIFEESDRPVVREDLPKMVYLDQVIMETLRLMPPGPVIGRRAHQEIPLNGVKAPRGCVIMAHLWSLHRNPEIFSDPLKFDPERFSEENCASRPQFAFAPFSGGLRACPGQSQGLMVVKTFLSCAVRKFVILPGDGCPNLEDLKPKHTMVLHFPALPLRFIRRNT